MVGLIRIMIPLCSSQALEEEMLESSEVRLSAGGTSQRSDPVMVIRRVDGKVVTAVFHSSLPFSTGVYWRKAATHSIKVIIVRNWQ